MMLGFEEMISKVVDQEAKVHIREAVRCYEAGAYRSSIVATYVSVCFDLISKMRSLAASGDAVAATLVASLDGLQQQLSSGNTTAISGLLNFERNLLDNFRDKFEFFGTQEFEELSRLRADRNRCAHPTFSHDTLPYSPPAELARLHIRSALIHVLSQPPKQGKAALASLRAAVLSPYFPTPSAEAIERLRGTELGAAREALVRAFIDDLLFGWPDPVSPYHHKGVVSVAIQATIEMHRPIALPRVIEGIQKLAKNTVAAEAVRFAGVLSVLLPEAATEVDAATQSILRTWISKENYSKKGGAVSQAIKIEWWKAAAVAAVSTLTGTQIAAVEDPSPEIVTQAAKLYSSSKNWTEANENATNFVNPIADKFSPDDIALIFKASAEGADLRGSHGFNDFISLLYDKNPIPPASLEALMDQYSLSAYKRGPQEEAA